MIELEFTEGALIEYSAVVSKAVKSLKELGVATALDDFGTGYSSLSYLRHFPIDTLKIDRIFVRDIISKSGSNTPLVDAIIAMAKSLGLATVAEAWKPKRNGIILSPGRRIRFKGFCFAGRSPSRIWSAGTLNGCIPSTPFQRGLSGSLTTRRTSSAPNYFAIGAACEYARDHE